MGMDLLSEHGDERFNARGWRWCLERAKEFGWSPEGTVAPIDFQGEWNGDYFTNDYQTVTDRDARALGEALLRAVAALSAREPDKIHMDEFAAAEFDGELSCLRRLANYALKGGFVIA
jgi:hypothetical protein